MNELNKNGLNKYSEVFLCEYVDSNITIVPYTDKDKNLNIKKMKKIRRIKNKK